MRFTWILPGCDHPSIIDKVCAAAALAIACEENQVRGEDGDDGRH